MKPANEPCNTVIEDCTFSPVMVSVPVALLYEVLDMAEHHCFQAEHEFDCGERPSEYEKALTKIEDLRYAASGSAGDRTRRS